MGADRNRMFADRPAELVDFDNRAAVGAEVAAKAVAAEAEVVLADC